MVGIIKINLPILGVIIKLVRREGSYSSYYSSKNYLIFSLTDEIVYAIKATAYIWRVKRKGVRQGIKNVLNREVI
jgi:hypothetical protein